MSYLGALVDHPVVLLLAVVVSSPILWALAKAWFPNHREDAAELTATTAIDVAGGPLLLTWPLVKIMWFIIASVAIVITFYKLGSWIAEW
jgi:hypothetical protein